MSATNLLNLNVDTLFVQHSVPEIDIVAKKIQAVVENKREELRTMVGERYRDLLKAADTIAAMQESSSTLIEQVDCISTNCRSLNEQQLIGFKTNDSVDLLRNRSANKQLNNYFSTMVQIKLLTSLPELIWSHIDQESFYAATELFIFSRHISTGLQLDAHNPLMQHLPVAKKQWEILKPFHVTIKHCAITVLEREQLCAEVAVDCLLSLLLLEKSNLNLVFKTFMQLRGAAFTNCLTDSIPIDAERRRVKERILASLKVLNGTIDLVEKCFMDKGLLLQRLSEHSDPMALPTIALMDNNDAQFSYMLPEVISNFRPKFETQTFDETFIRASLEQWLTDTQQIAGVQLKQLFELVATMNTIQEIKTEAQDYRKSLNYTAIVERFQLTQGLNFYERKYVPLINQRIRDIINDSWTQAMCTTFESLQLELQNAVSTTDPKRSFWTEHANELPLSLEAALSEDNKIKKLLMKTKGYDDDTIALFASFDCQLANIIAEMNVLLQEQATRAEDKVALIEFLRETAQSQLGHFVDKVKALHLTAAQRQQLLVVVRACMALVELCPHLKICFCQQSSWRQWVGNVTVNSLQYWNAICLMLHQEAFSFWQQLTDGILAEMSSEQYLPQAITHDVILEDFAHWETVTLEQKDEQDNTINSIFRVPSQPLLSLQTYLFALIRELNAVVPQTLPTQVLQAFNYKLLAQILAHYEILLAGVATAANQNIALQLYFDLKFLQSIFAIPRDERTLYAQFHKLLSGLKDIIDPFDFEIFAEHITLNVKRAVVRLINQLGVLTQTDASSATATPSLAHEKDPNVLSLSTCGTTSLWFPVLPIITQDTTNNAVAGDAMKAAAAVAAEKETTPTRNKTTTAQRKSETTTRTKSGAASFFGAMSQEWFR